ncbi:hypothetical protein J5N97_000141 [Dioscorea zingiberensis]|uniref:DELLA protein n=1 Tax=Dioscorea zingiberensis TaxID=325984 RepID=A0A9D5BSP1_9LILI|nr:hypothetical protein J5N97_000141 [Dioscorea zingiberensis]
MGSGSRSSSEMEVAFAGSSELCQNPSELSTWVDSMLSDLESTDTWTDKMYPPPQRAEEAAEGDGIRLVHLLMSSAEAVELGEAGIAGALIEEMRQLLTRVGTGFGIGKVAAHFVEALNKRLHSTSTAAVPSSSEPDYEILYHYYYEACPYLKFGHFTANQAILEAFERHDRVHVIDFSLMHGLQWPALIQALALRPGGPPFLRLTGIGPPSPDGRDSLREVGLRLAELARSVGVPFAFRGVAARRVDDVRPWMLHVAAGEAVAVNSVMQLHRLLGNPANASAPIDSVLSWIRELNPEIVTVVEQDADHNKPGFVDRFAEALFYYSTMFDSLEASRGGGAVAAVAEEYLKREIRDVVCCEGAERHEPLGRWRARMGRAGFKPVHLGWNAFKQASMLLSLFSGEGSNKYSFCQFPYTVTNRYT